MKPAPETFGSPQDAIRMVGIRKNEGESLVSVLGRRGGGLIDGEREREKERKKGERESE